MAVQAYPDVPLLRYPHTALGQMRITPAHPNTVRPELVEGRIAEPLTLPDFVVRQAHHEPDVLKCREENT